ncbi:MAG: hypothetical protein WKF31_02340 [Thermoleophilaceae bacterium]
MPLWLRRSRLNPTHHDAPHRYLLGAGKLTLLQRRAVAAMNRMLPQQGSILMIIVSDGRPPDCPENSRCARVDSGASPSGLPGSEPRKSGSHAAPSDSEIADV